MPRKAIRDAAQASCVPRKISEIRVFSTFHPGTRGSLGFDFYELCRYNISERPAKDGNKRPTCG